VRELKDIEGYRKFLEKYSTKAKETGEEFHLVSPSDLVNEDFSLKLSLAPQSKRTFVQASSGYTIADRLEGKGLAEVSRLIRDGGLRRKMVAYTADDVEYALKMVYKPNYDLLVRLLDEGEVPTVAIYARMDDL